MADSGQIELTTTPYFHPILPLLLDKKLAREAMPDAKLPRYSGGYPEDAGVHVRRAVEQHAQIFGSPPKGMWPAEGSVCQAMLPLLAQHGFRWLATDEGILSQSTQGFVSRDNRGHVRNPDHLYRAYKVAEAGHELGIVFRDHALSDMIGFHYQRSEPVAAAEDFVHHLRAIGQAVKGNGPALVPVILDGENCWESYPGGGVSFLRALYERCTASKDVRPVKIGEFLERQPPRDTLPHLFAGSWINHNFSIWIGHEEDNTAWDALHKAREHLLRRVGECERASAGAPESSSTLPLSHAPTLSPFQKAWEELYIAEGSDWFWWYGDEHSSAQLDVFDYLFRKHVQNVYLLLGDQPPPELARPISRRGQRAIHTLPRAFLEPKIDGRITYFEWVSAGRYTCQNERGTMAMVTRGPIKDVYFGFNLRELVVRIDFDQPAHMALTEFDVLRIRFLEPAGNEVAIGIERRRNEEIEKLDGTDRKVRPVRFIPQFLSSSIPQMDHETDLALGVDQVVEVAIPFARLAVKVDQPIQFYVELLQGGQSRDRAPREGAISLFCPSPDFEQIMWDV